jgi:hypothetical protein
MCARFFETADAEVTSDPAEVQKHVQRIIGGINSVLAENSHLLRHQKGDL